MNDVEKAIKVFHVEVRTTSTAFFAWKSFNDVVASDKTVYRVVNANALSWNILTHSLQSTFFISLGRLFDTRNDTFSAHRLLNICTENIDQFSCDSLKQRKIKSNGGIYPDWLDDFTKSTYQPSIADFRKLKKVVSSQQKIYAEIYKPIRHKVIAHREINSLDKVGELYGKTNIGQIKDLLIFLHQIDQVLFDLLHNGKLNDVGTYNFREDSLVQKDIEELLNRLKL